ncbi:MAG: bifunctional folylpolyglutamate synthase/dihydrofolate synthase [Candidatus Omnitrophica bacterium]|nr:bifunctional folylpolyglutamate synthase/dihydrofolate synthase [Candidatus Omnitrophota bacterium]
MDYLNTFTNYERLSCYNYRKAYNLDRIKKLLLLLDSPQTKYPSIIISGTKGKGSTANLLASILKQAGLKVGLFTSPHLVSLRERIQVSGALISEKEFCKTLSFIKPVIKKYRLSRLTYFEVLTALCLLYFARKGVDIAVLEVGLGGRLDATNVTQPLLSLITPISYDHTGLLGNTIEKITKEKCGIIKKNSYVISGLQTKEALKVIKDTAAKKESKLLVVGKDINCKNIKVRLSGSIFDAYTPYSSYKGLSLKLVGKHQVDNALLALTAAEILKDEFDFDIDKKHISSGLKRTEIAGRFQIISKSPYVILDSCQNKASAESLKNAFAATFGKKPLDILILGASSDKDIEGIGKTLCPMAKAVIFTKANTPRATEPKVLAKEMGKYCREHYVAYDAKDALFFAKSLCAKKGTILIAGSLFLVGDILR